LGNKENKISDDVAHQLQSKGKTNVLAAPACLILRSGKATKNMITPLPGPCPYTAPE